MSDARPRGSDYLTGSRDRRKGTKVRRPSMNLAVKGSQMNAIDLAQSFAALSTIVSNTGWKIGRRAADDAEHLARRRLLFQGFASGRGYAPAIP